MATEDSARSGVVRSTEPEVAAVYEAAPDSLGVNSAEYVVFEPGCRRDMERVAVPFTTCFVPMEALPGVEEA